MRKHWVTGLAATALLVGVGTSDLYAHCEVPCGVYTDQMRIDMIEEDCQTIEKAMAQIVELGAAEERNDNQISRWVAAKDDHANKIQHIVSQYFMTQRIKPPADSGDADAMKKYTTEVTLLHQMLVHAMKAKQTTDQAHVKHLRDLITQFEKSYHGHSH